MGRVNTNLSQAYLQTLLAGDRSAARKVIDNAIQQHNHSAAELLTELVWPTMELMQELFRDDRISVSNLNLGTRLNRSVSDQLCASLSKGESNGKKVLIFCGDDEPEELGGQICSEMFESEGWTVKFAGGGVPEDEVLNLIGRERPDLMIMFGTLPSAVPGVRKLIDYLREVNSCPQMQIMCCGGIYKRAEGLAEEIGADLYAPDAATAVTVARDNPDRKATAEQQTVGRSRRVRRPSQRIAPASNGQNTADANNSSSSTTML